MVDMQTPGSGPGECGSLDLQGNRKLTIATSHAQRERLPNRRRSIVFNFRHAGATYRCTASRFADGRLAELFLSVSKPSSALQAHADCAAVLASIAPQHRIDAETLMHATAGSAVATAIELAEA